MFFYWFYVRTMENILFQHAVMTSAWGKWELIASDVNACGK